MNPIQTELNALLEGREAFLAELQSWTPEQLRTQPQQGGWCALEVLDHVVISEKGTLGYILKKTSSGFDTLPLRTPETDAASAQLNKALESDGKWGAPSVLPPPNEKLSLEELSATWRGIHGKMEQWLAQFPEDQADRLVFKHPFAGRLTLDQTLGFLQRHITHHRYQLKRIQQAIS